MANGRHQWLSKGLEGRWHQDLGEFRQDWLHGREWRFGLMLMLHYPELMLAEAI